MIGFSILPNKLACFYDGSKPVIVAWDETSIKGWLDKIISSNSILAVSDSRDVYRTLSFLDFDYFSRLRIFDVRAFLNVYKNLQSISIAKLSKFCNISLEDEVNRLEKIWAIQGEKNWFFLPSTLSEIYLQKDSATAFKLAERFAKIQLPLENSSYLEFFSEFLYYLVRLEQTGLYGKNQKIVPIYEYDHIVTGRIVNTKPFCFQTASQEDFAKQFSSRFGTEDGLLIVADWQNADFRVAAALSNEKLTMDKLDPYTLIGSEILGRTITSEERQTLKTQVLSIMYGYDQRFANVFFSIYPNIALYKKKIIAEAKKNHQLTTHFGKTRFFESDDNFETKAFNTMNQMTVADLCKKAIIECQKEFSEKKFRSVMIPYVVYDKFGFDVLRSELPEVLSSIHNGLINRTIPSKFRQFVDFTIKCTDIYGKDL